MRYCKRCGEDLKDDILTCPECGMLSRPGRRLAPRIIAVVLLFIFVILGSGYLYLDQLKARSRDTVIQLPEETEAYDEPIIGLVFDRKLADQFEYPDGTMSEYHATDEEGNTVALYRDSKSGELQGYWVALPPARRNNLNIQQAEIIALETASQVAFFGDRQITLLEADYINPGSGAESYYYFYWAAVDQASGAVLLKDIEVYVHPEQGKVFYLNTYDGGTVHIDTIPEVGQDYAEQIALQVAREQFVAPRVTGRDLFVAIIEGEQRLVWNLCLDDPGDPEKIAYYYCVVVDAVTGEVVDVIF